VPDAIAQASAQHGIHLHVTRDPLDALVDADAVLIRADAIWFAAVETAGRLAQHSEQPVLLWAREASVACRVAAYGQGVADVLNALIDPVEFAVRIRGAVQRAAKRRVPTTVILATHHGDVTVTPARQHAEGSHGVVTLTALQWRLLSQLIMNCDRVQSHTSLLRAVWAGADDPSARHTLRTHISAIRRRLQLAPSAPRTVHGYGYLLSVSVQP